jgi:adenylate cyclase
MSRRLRLASGLAMLAYVTMHLLNHAVGLVSVAAMERVLRIVVGFWSLPPMQVLLYGGFAVHYFLALSALWQRRTLRLRPAEWAQLALGFSIPLLLVRHVVATRIGYDYFATDVGNYPYLLWVYFVEAPDRGLLQQLVLVVAWGHAMLGLHFWLRVRPWYGPPLRGIALVVAVLVPLLAWLGIIQSGREVAAAAAIPGWSAAASTGTNPPDPEAAAALERIGDGLIAFFVASLAAVLLGRLARRLWLHRRGTIRIAYPGGRSIGVLPGTSVLEASRLARIPHASICGGRGRCSTCRVRVRGSLSCVPPPSENEQRVLSRIRAVGSVRLACQLRPMGPVEVTPLLPPWAPAGGALPVDISAGSEREIAVLFADLRDFTALSEGRLPYDVVFVLNRYFGAMGRAIETAGGRVDKFIGDGIMALFGLEAGPDQGCREALEAARLMSLHLDQLNESLREELRAPLRIGIGIHAGPAIVGEMGYAGAATLTAIGDTVNTASRLEGLAKEYGCELIASDEVVARAGIDRLLFEWRRSELRGKQEALLVALARKAGDLPIADAATRIAGASPAA